MLLRVSIEKAGYSSSATIHSIQFELSEGQLLAVIGPNGSGKTTLVRAISQVLPFIDAQIHINGTNLMQTNETERSRLIAVVPQSTFVPPHFLVEEVVLMGRAPYMNWSGRAKQDDLDRARKAMGQTDVEKFRYCVCGELSAGERQRVILARALAQDTPVLLMDEPTSHLDLRHQIEFLELTRSLCQKGGKTVLVAMHDLNLAARFGDVFLAMKYGTTDAFGNAQDVLLPEKLSEIYGLAVKVIKLVDGGRTVVIPQ
ncbi:MAG: ABC transporter ATP-binding protein [Pelolinea sp.]|nr:ABC transporter ATP-binding protein [Pelolinea sp.]